MAKTFASSVRLPRWGLLAQVLAGVAFSVACSSTPQVPTVDGPGMGDVGGTGGTDGPSGNGGTGNIDVGPNDAGSSNNPGAAGDDNPDAPRCGDGKVGPDEGCDDGNALSGDGCDGTCKVETGYVCDTAGEACTSTLVCGDGLPGPDEACDDGNTKSGDGCSKTCSVEAGYSCDKDGEPCTPTTAPAKCGNGKTEVGETCDDGNTTSDDGCSKTCQTDPGYTCNGATCTPNAECGDGTLNSGEQCDDNNQVPGDCCSSSCKLEANCKCSTPSSGSGPQKCESTIVCGDGAVAAVGEACDDGNTADHDGCSADCQNIEPGYTCPAAGGGCSVAVVTCPNSIIDPGEECDDGKAAGSGCSANCKVETGYVCPTAGAACKLKEFCGNGKVSFTTGETCDDGNATGSDGCSAACTIEAGWSCDNTASPSVCTKEVCGNKKIAAGETCDDGNTTPGDGCNSVCKLEAGYTCPAVGLACRTICGDKNKLGLEQCDDGNLTNGDGCNSRCQLEPGSVCDAAGVCKKTVCGDKVKEGTEQCDDTAVGAVDLPFDGCYKCLKEPDCSTGPCQSTCGDGQRFSDEACDDGNTFDGDGCSSTCQIETGFNCVDAAASALPTKKDLPVVVRDFVGLARESSPSGTNSNYHPDFNRHNGGGIFKMVKTTLSATGKPEWRWLPYKTAEATAVANQTTYTPLSTTTCTCNEAAAAGSWTTFTENWAAGGTEGADKSISLLRPPCSCSDNTACTCDNSGHMYRDAGVSNTSLRRNLSTPGNFAEWFTNVAGTNLTVPYTLSLSLDVPTATYSNLGDANSTAFDPLKNLGWIKSGAETDSGCGSSGASNVSFTTETHFVFEYQGGERFDFSGDDDTWVFVNRKLAVDLGGLHGKQTGYFILDADTDGVGVDTADGTAVSFGNNNYYDGTSYSGTQGAKLSLGLVRGKIYEVVMFQAERNQCGSNFGVTLKNFGKPNSICTSPCGDGVVAADEACDLGTANNTGGYGGCNANCTLAPYCGDKAINGSETCDDGVNANVYGSMASGCAPGCKVAPYCGDSTVDVAYGETCDKGAANSATAYGLNACTNTCQPAPYCGDGVQNSNEACDEGQSNGGPSSKCDTTCAVKCGNGHLDPGEQCDLGASNNTGAYGGCKSTCQLAPYCGDGVKQANEGCDDGKNDGSYGTCTASCQLGAYCGDAHQDPGELCDLGPQNQSNAYGKNLCTTTCKPAPYCGDHVVNTTPPNVEVCDDGASNSNTAASACKLDCSGYNPTAQTCGNGKIDAGEQCDDGVDKNGIPGDACDARCHFKCGNGFKDMGELCDNGVNDGSYGTCKNDCTLAEFCGDGTKNGAEQCDLGAGNSATAYGPNKCTSTCKVAPYCGDHRVNGTEECDGQVGCNALCAYDMIK